MKTIQVWTRGRNDLDWVLHEPAFNPATSKDTYYESISNSWYWLVNSQFPISSPILEVRISYLLE